MSGRHAAPLPLTEGERRSLRVFRNGGSGTGQTLEAATDTWTALLASISSVVRVVETHEPS